MADRITAERQLARILELLPRASRAGGVALGELAAEMGVAREDILIDLTEVYTRAFYQPAGAAEDVQVLIDTDNVSVWTTGEFRRPVRLTPRESLALGLALRLLAGENESDGEELSRLLASIGAQLLDERSAVGSEAIHLHPPTIAPGGSHAVIADAARDRRQCRIVYLKSGASEPGERTVDPYVLVASADHWYLIAHCHASSEVRVFRVDRILDASPLGESFELPSDFDASAYISDGRVYLAHDFVEVTVRYSPAIARWIVELGPVELLDDGSALVRYSVADLEWITRHVLEHGPDAEIVSPPAARTALLNALRRIRAQT